MTYSLSLNRKNSSSENQNKSREEPTQLNLPHNHHIHHHPPPPPPPPAPHRRFSLSTPEELRSSLLPPSFPQLSSSLSDEEYIASDHHHHHNQYDDASLRSNNSNREGSSVSSSPSISTSPSSSATTIRSNRVARLVRQQELSRTRRFFLDNKLVFPSGKSTSDSTHPRSYLEEWIQEDAKIPSSNGFSSTNTTTAAATTNIIHHGPEDIVRSSRQRLLVVANRLPVSATKCGPDWSLEVSAGGLVSALLGVRQFETRWIGWAGVNVTDEADQIALTKALEEQRCVPVFLDEETVHQYYNGYCNNVLWPLFHYLGLPQEDRLSATRSLEDQLKAYKRANSMFAEVVYRIYKEGDIIWCHDYHLMFLPKCLKDLDSKMKVGWFLHTPFPSSEIYRTLPSRSELLKAVLCADLIGDLLYSDYDGYSQFPIGIDPQRFFNALETPEVQMYIKELQDQFAGRKVMLGVDRLDMIKGIPQKLLAFEKFLDENAQWRDKVQLVQIAVPTRTDVHDYQRLTSQVHEIVGRINGRFGTLTTVPIHHLDRSLDFHKLCALYAITDVALVTSLRDGMNLVSYEFVACQNMKKGVLILSELAGAAQSLGAGAILVNPWNISDVAAAIKDALDMSEDVREECHRHNFDHVSSHTAQSWADTFVNELNDTILEAQLRILRIPPHLPVGEAVTNYHKANNRLLILGFNLTLTAQVEGLGRRAPDQLKLRLHSHLHDVFGLLCNDPKTTIIILSGSERSVLDEAFGNFNLWLAAENGMFLRHTSGEWKTTMPEHLNMDWMESVQPVFEYFLERTPRSYLEIRDTCLVWNYKNADVEFGRLQARDMLQHLWTGPISNASVDVVQGTRSVEVRPVGVSKGAAIDRILGEIAHRKRITTPIDYVLCIGHFLSKDEDIYTFFEPELPVPFERENNSDGRHSSNRRTGQKAGERAATKSGSKSSGTSTTKLINSNSTKSNGVRSKGNITQSSVNNGSPSRSSNKKEKSFIEDEMVRQEGSSVLDLRGDNYFSCAVGRKRSNARYSLPSSEEVVSFLKHISDSCKK